MNKAPAPSKISIEKLDELMVYDVVSASRTHRMGEIDNEYEDKEVAFTRREQRATNYKKYRDWYKGLTPAGRAYFAKELGW